MTNLELTYVGDPMCSWCYGFAPQWEQVRAALRPEVRVSWVQGGLAPDSDEPMPEELRAYVQGAWRAVRERTGVEFNWAFWEECEPRRSTYPACRAVLAAEALRPGATPAMFDRIQRAYYAEARNPSDAQTLVGCAVDLGLEADAFAQALAAPATQATLERDFARRDALGASGFPSLIGRAGERVELLARGWAPAAEVLRAVDALAPGSVG